MQSGMQEKEKRAIELHKAEEAPADDYMCEITAK